MMDLLQITTILIAVFTIGISKRNMQRGFFSLTDAQKIYFNRAFFRFRLIQYPVIFFTVVSSIMITGGHVKSENAELLFLISLVSVLLWMVHTYFFIRQERPAGGLPEVFLKDFFKDRMILFILLLFLLFNAFLKLKLYQSIHMFL